MKWIRVMKWQWLNRLICVPAAMLFFVLSAQAQRDFILPPFGGDGGGQFFSRCPQGQHLAGFNLRTGDDVDAIQPICVAAYGPADVGPPALAPWNFGGTGTGNVQLLCPKDAPILIAMYVGWAGQNTIVVKSIHLFCGAAAIAQKPSEFPDAVFDGPKDTPAKPNVFYDAHPEHGYGTTQCPDGFVPVGINGRSGIWLDAVGLICGALELTPKPVPPPEPTPVKALGRVKVPPGTTPSPPISICESARRARARDSPAAPGLEAQCRAVLAAKGAAIAEADEIVAAARAVETDVLYRQGFDIATGIFGDPALGALGNTATGPGSLGIRDSLTAAGQRGFNASMTLHLSRNYKP